MIHNATLDEVNEQVDEYGSFESTKRIAVPIVFTMVTLLGFLGNGLLVWIILRNKKMRTPTNLLILNLAVVDFLFIVICLPFTGAAFVLPKYVFGTAWCKISQYSMYVLACVSIYSLVLMSAVRCIVVVRPLWKQSLITRHRVYISIAVVWIVILGGFSPLLVHYEVVSYSYFGEERSVCVDLAAATSISIQHSLSCSSHLDMHCLFVL